MTRLIIITQKDIPIVNMEEIGMVDIYPTEKDINTIEIDMVETGMIGKNMVDIDIRIDSG